MTRTSENKAIENPSMATPTTRTRRGVREALLALSATLVLSSVAWAQPKIVPKDDVEGAKEVDISGWNPSLGVNGTVNFVSNSNVVGQVEGLSMLLGLGVTGSADYVQKNRVWRTTLSISESFAKTPVIDRFIKTNDVVDLETTYNYFFHDKLGVFARGNAKTSLFNSQAISADPIMYTILSADPGGAPVGVLSDELEVSSPFKPLALAESLGVFAQPYTGHGLTVRLRAGLGGRHTFASGVLINKDDANTPEIEMQELANVHQAGAEVFVGLDGKAKGGRITYIAGATMLLPFINNDAFDRSATELLSMGIQAEVKVAVFDWMSVVYKATLINDPQLFPDGEEVVQFQNNLLLTFQFTLVEKEKAKAKPKESELDVIKRAKEEAEKAADEARKEADAARQRAEELERALDEAKNAAPPDDTDPTGTDADGTDADGTDADGTDADGTDADGTDADGQPQ